MSNSPKLSCGFNALRKSIAVNKHSGGNFDFDSRETTEGNTDDEGVTDADVISTESVVTSADDASVKNIKGEVQSRITIISKESIKISLQIGAKMMKIG